MTPQHATAMLLRQISKHGEKVDLIRLTGTQLTPLTVTCRAFVRAYRPEELVGGIIQGDSRVILSPQEIEANGWPGPNSSATPTGQDRRVPRKGDRIVIAGKVRNIESGTPVYLAGQLVRIEVQARG